MRAKDPARALRGQVRRGQEDGVRITALLVARLRLERLLRASADAREWYESDLRGFTEVFRDYHAAVPPIAFFPAGEARLFRVWCAHPRKGERASRPARGFVRRRHSV
jgi:hypothetical protein